MRYLVIGGCILHDNIQQPPIQRGQPSTGHGVYHQGRCTLPQSHSLSVLLPISLIFEKVANKESNHETEC